MPNATSPRWLLAALVGWLDHHRTVSIGLAVILSVAVVTVIFASFLIGRQRSPHLSELGPISTRWLSEHQAHSRDSER